MCLCWGVFKDGQTPDVASAKLSMETHAFRKDIPMSLYTLFLIVLVVILLGGGGVYLGR
jgi:hypothetical protein